MSTPPPPAKKKSGCGFLRYSGVLAVLLILSTGRVAGFSYLDYAGLGHILSPTAANIPAVDGSDAAYAVVQQKLAAMQDQLKNHQPATITLTGNDLNSLIAHTPALSDNNVLAYISLKNNAARLQTSVPTGILTQGAVKGRYFNMDISFSVSYDTLGRSVNVTPTALKVGDQMLLGPGIKNPAGTGFDQALMAWMLNFGLRQNADIAALLDQTQSIEIKNGEFVISTR